MIRIKEDTEICVEGDILSMLDAIYAILNNTEVNSNFDYILTSDDMSSLQEKVSQLRRNFYGKNEAVKRSVRATKKRRP